MMQQSPALASGSVLLCLLLVSSSMSSCFVGATDLSDTNLQQQQQQPISKYIADRIKYISIFPNGNYLVRFFGPRSRQEPLMGQLEGQGDKRSNLSGGMNSLSGGMFPGKRATGGVPDSISGGMFPGKRSPSGVDSISGGMFPGKRAANGLDSISGGMFPGKRSSPVGFINYEPIFGRRFGPLNSMPRVYDMRSAPLLGSVAKQLDQDVLADYD